MTHLVSIKTKEPIDTRIYNLQKIKARDVDRTLQDDGHTPQSMSEAELKETFMRMKEEKQKKIDAKAKRDAAKNAKKKNA